MVAASVAAWSTSSRSEPVLACTAPTTAPSTSGASEMRTRPRRLLEALHASLDGVQRIGAASKGDKTMVDALAPALAAYELELRTGGSLETAVRAASQAARDGARATVPMQARKGRASYLGPRSVGHQDPGATSTALMFTALERAVLADRSQRFARPRGSRS